MKILSVGAAGKMGRAVVAYLANDPEVVSVGLLDIHTNALKSLQEADPSKKLKSHFIDVEKIDELKEVIRQYDVAVVTLPNRRLSYKVMEAAIDARVSLVDVIEEYHRKPDNNETEGFVIPSQFRSSEEYGEQLHEKAIRNDVLILDGMGFAPGLSNITTAYGISQLDSCETAIARVGGIPNIECCDKHPLRYMTTWSLEHVLREYSVTTQIIRNGKIVEIPALSDMECFKFTEFGIDQNLECAVTPGMPSFIFTHPNLKYFAEKTVRWPGHFQGVRTLIECGLFDEEQVDFNGVKISPRQFFLKIINPLLAPGDNEGDICVMYNTITGQKDGNPSRVEYFMWEDARDDFSAMARVTGFPAAIGAKLVASGKIDLRGIRAPEECIAGVNYTRFIEELEKKDILIKAKFEMFSS
jgi:saccharopine dehydrogenase-like NADP-dependent oxidoreductase